MLTLYILSGKNNKKGIPADNDNFIIVKRPNVIIIHHGHDSKGFLFFTPNKLFHVYCI